MKSAFVTLTVLVGMLALLQPARVEADDKFGSTVVTLDWVAGCDNMGNCSAVSLPVRKSGTPFDVDRTIEVKVEIDTGSDGPVFVELATTIDTAVRRKYPDRRIAVDGEVLPIEVYWRDGIVRIEGNDADVLIRRLTGSRRLQLLDSGVELAEARIEGFSEVLEHVRRAVSDNFALSAEPIRLPARDSWIARRIDDEQLARLAETDECRRYSKARRPIEEVQYVRLDERHTLAIAEVACGNYAGHNKPVRLLIINDDEQGFVYPAMFEPHPLDHLTLGPNYLANAHWNERFQTLHTFHSTFGSAYCGAHATFAWDGSIFRLVEYRLMPVCRGSTNFITTYRRRTARDAWHPAPVVPMSLPPKGKDD